MLSLLIAATLGGAPARATTPSPLLTRLHLRVCAAEFSPVREGVIRAWFEARVPRGLAVVNGLRDLTDDEAGRRAFAIDELLERLGEVPAGRARGDVVPAETWQLELLTDADEDLLSPGISTVLLGDRLLFDVADRELRDGEFLIGVHWDQPADPLFARDLWPVVRHVLDRTSFRHLTARGIVSGDAREGELYVSLEGARGGVHGRLDAAVSFARALGDELHRRADSTVARPR